LKWLPIRYRADPGRTFTKISRTRAVPGSTTPISQGNSNGNAIATDQLLTIPAAGTAGIVVPQANFLGLP
jgi:hypothetical protein